MKKYLFKHPFWLAMVVISTIASALVDVYFAFVIKSVVDVTHAGSYNDFINRIVFAICFLSLTFILALIRKLIESRYIKVTLISLKGDVFNGQLDQSISKFMSQNSANYLSSLTNDITLIEQDYFLNVLEIIDNIFIFIISLFSILYISYQVTIGIIILGLLPLLFPILFGNKLSKKRFKYSEELSRFTIHLKDSFSGFEIIKSFHINAITKRHFTYYNESVEQAKFEFNKTSALVNGLTSISGSLMHLAAISIGTYFLMQGTLTFGDLLATLQLMGFVVQPIVQIATRSNKVKSSKDISNKLINYSHIKNKSTNNIEKEFFNSHLALSHINFSYGSKENVLKDISHVFEKNKKYAIVGPSGSGKSTLLKLILKYYDDYEGNIFLDDMNYRTLSDEVLYKFITIILQKVYMFDDTLRNNVTLFHDYDEDTIIDVVDQSQMNDFVIDSLNGLDTFVGEDGNTLSGGEKQRIAIARALIKNTPIIAIDEGTSALDPLTASKIENSILKQFDKTVIVVTHKLNESILNEYDEIIVMEDGQIKDVGSYEMLLQNSITFGTLIKKNKASQ